MWTIVAILLQLYLLCLLGRIVLSWFPPSTGGPMEAIRGFLYTVTEPVLAPVRAMLPPVRIGGMGLDLSVMIVFLLIIVVLGVLPV